MNWFVRWRVIAAYALVAASTQMLWVTFAPITTQAASILHVSEGAVGWLSEVFPLLYVILAIPCGMWTDKWFRPSLAAGAILTAAGAIIRLDSSSFAVILIGQVVISIGQPLVLNAINKIAAAYMPEEKRTVAIAIGSASLFLGILFAMFSGPLLIQSDSVGLLLWGQAGFTVVCSGLLILCLRLKPVYGGETLVSVPLREVWKDSFTRRLSILLFIGFGLFIAITTWLEALLNGKGVSSVEVGFALALMTASGMVGAAVLPDFAIRAGKARSVTLAAIISMGVTLFVLIFGRPFWLILLLLSITGFLLLAVLPIILSIAEKHFPREQVGTVTGLLMLAGNGGGIVLALLVQLFIGTPLMAILILIGATLAVLPVISRFPSIHKGAVIPLSEESQFAVMNDK